MFGPLPAERKQKLFRVRLCESERRRCQRKRAPTSQQHMSREQLTKCESTSVRQLEREGVRVAHVYLCLLAESKRARVGVAAMF